MRDPVSSFWGLSRDLDLDRLAKKLPKTWSIGIEKTQVQRICLCDSQDWGLWQSGAVLQRRAGGQCEILQHDALYRESKVSNSARFWWQFPEGKLRDFLTPRIDLRALQTVFDGRRRSLGIAFKDKEQKTVVRCRLEILTRLEAVQASAIDPQWQDGAQPEAACALEIIALRGYDKEYREICALLQQIFGKHMHSAKPGLGLQLAMSMLQLGPGAGVASPQCRAGDRVDDYVASLLLFFIEQAEVQTRGIVNDIDTEFLHDFRVNLRKSRSLLKLMKNDLPAGIAEPLRENLAALARQTNDLRDLDVFLLDRDYYASMLPENYASGIEEVFSTVTEERQNAWADLAGFMRSSSYRAALESSKKLLRNYHEIHAKKQSGKSPCNIDSANANIIKRFKKVSKLAQAIDGSETDDDIHAIRIECKKLRYLLEFFRELYPKKSIAPAIKRLKLLQEVLGRFNDGCVQLEFLQDLMARHKGSASYSAAMNGLIAAVYQKKLHERRRSDAAIARFLDQEAQQKLLRGFDAVEGEKA